jgi:purine-binding chemotaxis protein CheW
MANPRTDEQGQYLTFRVAGEDYGVGILRAREILEYRPMTRVPGAPVCVRGVMNLRGSVLPVVDLAVKFGQPESPVTKRTCVVVVEGTDAEKMPMGLLADSVSQVVQLAPEAIRPAPQFGTRARREYLDGVGCVGEKFVMLLDLDRLLSPEELEAILGAEAPAAEPPRAAP